MLAADWVLREEGSGTRSEFENAVAKLGASPRDLKVALVLPSNEAVLSAVCAGQSAAAISSAAAKAYLGQRLLVQASFDLPARSFRLLRHKERHASKAALTLEAMCKSYRKFSSLNPDERSKEADAGDVG